MKGTKHVAMLADRGKSRRQLTSPETTVQTSGASPEQSTTPGLSSTAAEQRLVKDYASENADRTDYPSYRLRGIRIGSGAVESLHRIAPQMRCKLAGAKWLPETAIAVIRMRLMLIADRWDDFWSRADLTPSLVQAFAAKAGGYAG